MRTKLVLVLFLGAAILAACRRERVTPTAPVVAIPTTEINFETATPARPVRATAAPADTATATVTRPIVEMAPPTMRATATRSQRPIATATRVVAPTNTATHEPEPPAATATATVTLTPTPTATEMTDESGPTPTATAGALAIHRFELVAQEELNPGKRLTFSWSAQGDIARLIAGTQQRFTPWWEVPVSDTMTIELRQTLFRDPVISLQVFGPADANGLRGDPIFESITIPWACDHDYFFTPAPDRCPRDAAVMPPGAQQEFEGGRMVWLQPENKILVFFDGVVPGETEARLRTYDDLWVSGDPESDPAIVPPPGRLQPVRGFGKVWRDNPEVREGLGWALAPESSFTATWQFEYNESIGTTSYLRLSDNRIARVVGYYTGFGSWRYLES